MKAPVPEREYTEALLRDLAFELQSAPESREVSSLFFGGGTPSLFSAEAIARILDGVAGLLRLAADIEITLEANPGTAEATRFRGYRRAGVNRLSIGAQSFDDARLRALGRIHDGSEAARAIGMARDAGFDNLNLDLMFALPEQPAEAALHDLETALSFHPEHLSWYHLTLEPNTEFAVHPPVIPDADAAAAMHDAGCVRLAEAGFVHYETSAFARAGRAARHNLNYWRFGDYLGIGAGAHAKRSFLTEAGLRVERRARHKHPRTYQHAAGTADVVQEARILQPDELPFEFCMNLLRLAEGFTLDDFTRCTGGDAGLLDPGLAQALRLGLLRREAGRVLPTEAGRRYQNRLFELFL